MKPISADTPPERMSRPEPGLRLAARSGLDVMLNDAVLEDGGVGPLPEAPGGRARRLRD